MPNNPSIEEHLKNLPPSIQALFNAKDWEHATEAVATEYLLNPDQTAGLKTEVAMTLIGLTDPRDLAKNLAENMDLAADLAEEITISISHQVLPPFIDALAEIKTTATPKTDTSADIRTKFSRITSRFSADQMVERFAALSPKVQGIIMGNDIGATIGPIAQKYDLHVDQAGILAEVAILVILGLIRTTEFINEVEHRLVLPRTKATDIAYEIDQKLFKPIRDDLRNAGQPSTASQTPIAQTAAPQQSINPAPEANVIHPHPAQKAYYGSVPPQFAAPAPAPAAPTPEPASTQTSAPKIDPYREPTQ